MSKAIDPKTELIDNIREKFTHIQPCCVEGEPDAHTTWLKVNQQSFCLSHYQETKQDAEWMRNMLAVALTEIVISQLRTDNYPKP